MNKLKKISFLNFLIKINSVIDRSRLERKEACDQNKNAHHHAYTARQQIIQSERAHLIEEDVN